MSAGDTPSSAGADWIRAGRGNSPSLNWSFAAEGTLTGLALARESGEVVVADSSGMLCKLDRRGRIAALTRLPEPARHVSWSDDGRSGVAVCGESTIYYFNHVLQTQWQLDSAEALLTVALAPFGSHLLVTGADGMNRVYDAAKKRQCVFETMRPLAFARFLSTEAGFVAAAEHGLVARYRLSGQAVWNDKLWSNVGELAVAGDGSLIFLAGFGHGVQVYDGEGETVGSYLLEGTVSRVDVSFEAQRIIAATIERSLTWLDADGELLWSTQSPDTVEAVQCDPLGEWIICGLKCGRVFRLDWAGRRADL